jgi:hypothetical protein
MKKKKADYYDYDDSGLVVKGIKLIKYRRDGENL